MSQGTWGLAGYRLRTTLARRAGRYLTVVVLIASSGAVAMASVAAARRTSSAYPVFLRATHASALQVSVYQAVPNGGGGPSLVGAIAALPGVRSVRSIQGVMAVPLDPRGAPRLATIQGSLVIAGQHGMFSVQDRLAVVAGRAADPRAPGQIVVTSGVASVWGVHVGSIVPLGLYRPAQQSLPGFGTPAVKPVRTIRARVTGIVAIGEDLVQDQIDRTFGFAIATPALARIANRINPAGAVPVSYGVAIEGARFVAPVEAAIVRLIPRDYVSEFHLTSRVVTAVALAVRPEVVALDTFGIIAALVGLILSLQAISRGLRQDGAERRVLRAFGARPRDLRAEAIIAPALSVVVGAALAAAGAVALSPLGPIGPVRPVYPDPGVSLDGVVVGWCTAAIVAILVGATVALVARDVARSARPASGHRSDPPRVARATHGAGLPLTCALGAAFALDSPRHQRDAPARSALLGTAVAVGLVATTLTFASGLNTLVSHPALYGWTWDMALVPSNNVPLATLAALSKDSRIAAWSGAQYIDIDVNRISTPVLIQRPGSRVTAPVTDGHGLRSDRQVVLGAATMAELHTRIGGVVTVSFGSPASRPAYVPPTRLTVVGTATFPAIGYSSIVADHTSMGTGALIPLRVLPPALRLALSSRDPVLAGPSLVFVRYKAGVSEAAKRADAARLVAFTDGLYRHDSRAAGNNVAAVGPQQPSQIVNYRTIGSTPEVLAGALSAGAFAGMVVSLGAAVRRRRRDLAVLKTLGFTRRQLSATVAWQASIDALVGIVIGVPFGVFAGRALWLRFARNLNAVPVATVSTTEPRRHRSGHDRPGKPGGLATGSARVDDSGVAGAARGVGTRHLGHPGSHESDAARCDDRCCREQGGAWSATLASPPAGRYH